MLSHFLLFPVGGLPGSPITLEACGKHTRQSCLHKMNWAFIPCFYLVISMHFAHIS